MEIKSSTENGLWRPREGVEI